MGLLIVGLLLAGLKLAGVSPVAGWSWWWLSLPFVGAVLWWHFVDASGITKKREMDKMDARKEARRQKNLDHLGLGGRDRQR